MNSLVSNPNIANNIASMRLAGNTMAEIASEYGVAPSTVCKALNTPQMKALIEQTYSQIVSLVPKVYETYANELNREAKDRFDRRIKLDVASKVGDITGLSPIRDSKNSVFLTNILAPTNITLSPIVAEILGRWGAGKPTLPADTTMPNYDTIEGEVVDK